MCARDCTYEESLLPGVHVLLDVHVDDFSLVPLHISFTISSLN